MPPGRGGALLTNVYVRRRGLAGSAWGQALRVVQACAPVVTNARRVGALLAAAALATGCGGEQPAVIDWDLSSSRTTAHVDWPTPDLDSTVIEPIQSVRIRFPRGRVFVSDGDVVHDVTLAREDDAAKEIDLIQIDSHPRTTEDAYRLAVRWAEQWRLPHASLDDWYEGRVKTPVLTTATRAEAGPGGLVPAIEIRYSFNDERPALVSLRFSWAPESP